MKKIIALALTLILVFALAAPASAAKDGSVYWLNFKPELDETAQKLAAMYTEQTGVAVKVVTAASGTYDQTLGSELDKSSAPTMFVVGNQEAVAKWGEFCMDLTGTPIVDELNSDAYHVYDPDGRLVSVGYCFECFGLVVNPDLVEAAGHSMDELVNFEGLKAVAEDIHARAGELGFDAFVSTDMDDSASWRVTGHLINLVYYYEMRDAGGWDSCPAELSGAYMDNFKALYDLIINNSISAPADLVNGGHDPANQLKTGKAAFFLTGSWDYAALSADCPNVTMIPYYCGVEGEEKAGINCGTSNCWAINDSAADADKQATMDFMVWLVTDPEASGMLSAELGDLPYTKATPGNNAFLNAANEYAANGCYVMEWASNFQPNSDAYRPAFVSALNAYNADQSEANWEQVVTAAIGGWAVQAAAAKG